MKSTNFSTSKLLCIQYIQIDHQIFGWFGTNYSDSEIYYSFQHCHEAICYINS